MTAQLRAIDAIRPGVKLSEVDAAARRVRRSHVAHTIIRHDPDRHMVVSVYGESMTQAIEEASML